MGFVYDRKIKVRSVIENLSDAGLPEGEPEVTESVYQGQITLDGERSVITYRENSEGGAIFSSVTVKQEEITVQRRGAVSCEMHFGDAEDAGVYRVEPYAFDFRLRTLKIRNRLEKATGTLDIFYRLTLGGADKKVRFSLTAEEN